FAGKASIHNNDETARALWDKSRSQSLICYRQSQPPGTAIAAPDRASQYATSPAPDAGYENFTVVNATIEEIEWLYLAKSGHRRAKFSWADDYWGRTWLTP
ncbi:MAG: pyridoxamine 5'-phosphate oxidase, partial [Pseudomonadota bacterium]